MGFGIFLMFGISHCVTRENGSTLLVAQLECSPLCRNAGTESEVFSLFTVELELLELVRMISVSSTRFLMDLTCNISAIFRTLRTIVRSSQSLHCNGDSITIF